MYADVPNLDDMWPDELADWIDNNPQEHSGVVAVAINLLRAKRIRLADDWCDIPEALRLERRADRIYKRLPAHKRW